MAISPRCALLSSGMKKENPVPRRVHAICGNVKSSSVRRPKVSMVHIAGKAKMKLTIPNPKDARRAFMVDAPASAKTVEE